jgi:SHS2 domain-containing protein
MMRQSGVPRHGGHGDGEGLDREGLRRRTRSSPDDGAGYSGRRYPVPSPPSFENFAHDADIGVRGRGATLAEALANAGRALTAVVTDPASVREALSVEITCAAPDPETLLFDWLNALVFEMATRHVLFARYEVKVEGAGLVARAFGEPVDVARHLPAVEVKGATWTALRVARAGGAWVAECVVDV